MKKLLAVLLLFVCVTAGYGQDKIAYGKTQGDYEGVFAKFMEYYNHEQGGSMQGLLSGKWGAEKAAWSDGTLRMMNMQFGQISFYTYTGPNWGRIDEYGAPMIYFKVSFSKPAVCDKPSVNGKTEHMVCLSLDADGKIQAINFITEAFHTNGTRVKY